MSWDLFSRLIWLPFTIMHRISRQCILLGRNVYGSLFSSRPAIKPAKPPAPEPDSSSSKTLETTTPKTTRVFSGFPGNMTSSSSNNCVVNIDSITTTAQSSLEFEQVGRGADDNMSASNNTSGQNDNKIFEKQVGACLHSHSESEPASPLAQFTLVNELGVSASTSTTSTQNTQCETVYLAESGSDLQATEKRLSRETKRSISREEDNERTLAKPDDHGLGEPCNPKKAKLIPDEGYSVATTSTSERLSKKKSRSKKKEKVLKEDTGRKEPSNMGRAPPPNYFIAVQVSNEDIIAKVSQLQQTLSEKPLDPPWHDLKTTEIFKDAMVPVTKLHFTLHVMNLKGDEEVEKARMALAKCCSEVHQQFRDNPLDLKIEGLGHFKNSVIFAQIRDQAQISRLTKLSDLLREKLMEQGIAGDPRPFKPHMTIAKISRSNKLHKKKIRAFPPDIWSGCEDTHFGTQRVTGIQLLCMQGEDKLTGYYRCYAQCDFHDPPNPSATLPPTLSYISPSPVSSRQLSANKVDGAKPSEDTDVKGN